MPPASRPARAPAAAAFTPSPARRAASASTPRRSPSWAACGAGASPSAPPSLLGPRGPQAPGVRGVREGEKSRLVTHAHGRAAFPCPQGGEAFSHKAHVSVHLTIHTGERPHRCHPQRRKALPGRRVPQGLRGQGHRRPARPDPRGRETLTARAGWQGLPSGTSPRGRRTGESAPGEALRVQGVRQGLRGHWEPPLPPEDPQGRRVPAFLPNRHH